jgi:hypothetical protein
MGNEQARGFTKSEPEPRFRGNYHLSKRNVAEPALPAAQIGEKLYAENEVNLDKQQIYLTQ